jgi:hypothetical protein
MKKLKKFKRFNQGGLGSSEGEGDPFAKKTEFAPGQGERNLESIKDFFMGRRSRGEASAPIEERDTSRKTPEPPKEERLTQPEPVKTEKAPEKTEKEPAKDRGETDFNYEPQRPYNQALEDAKEQGRRARDAFKPAKPAAGSSSSSGPKLPAKPPKAAEKTPAPAAEKTPAPAAEKTPSPAKSKVPAKIDSEKLLKDAEEEVLRKKPTAMTEQMRKAPTIRELYKGQKSMGDEIGDALKSFRESIRSGNDKGFKGALAKQFDTPPFHGKERKENKGKFVIEHDEYAKGGKVKAYAKGGFVSRGDGCAIRGKTKGRMV